MVTVADSGGPKVPWTWGGKDLPAGVGLGVAHGRLPGPNDGWAQGTPPEGLRPGVSGLDMA